MPLVTNACMPLVQGAADASPLMVRAAGTAILGIIALLTPNRLMAAAGSGHRRVLEALLKQAPKGIVDDIVHDIDGNASTALFYAAKAGDVQAMAILEAAGLNAQHVNCRRHTALHIAAREGHVKAIDWLVAHGADVNAESDKACTPLHLAAGSHGPRSTSTLRLAQRFWRHRHATRTAASVAACWPTRWASARL